MFEKGNANWLSESPSIIKKYNNTIHNSTKLTPNQASKKSNEKLVTNNLKDDTEQQSPKFQINQSVRTNDIIGVFTKSDSTKSSNILYTNTEVIRDTIRGYRIDYLPKRYNDNSFLPTKLSNEQNKKFMKGLNLFQ